MPCLQGRQQVEHPIDWTVVPTEPLLVALQTDQQELGTRVRGLEQLGGRGFLTVQLARDKKGLGLQEERLHKPQPDRQRREPQQVVVPSGWSLVAERNSRSAASAGPQPSQRRGLAAAAVEVESGVVPWEVVLGVAAEELALLRRRKDLLRVRVVVGHCLAPRYRRKDSLSAAVGPVGPVLRRKNQKDSRRQQEEQEELPAVPPGSRTDWQKDQPFYRFDRKDGEDFTSGNFWCSPYTNSVED